MIAYLLAFLLSFLPYHQDPGYNNSGPGISIMNDTGGEIGHTPPPPPPPPPYE